MGWARVQRGERGGTADATTGIKLSPPSRHRALFSVTLFSFPLFLSLSAYALFFSPHLLRQMSHAPIKNNGGRRATFPPPPCASSNQTRELQPYSRCFSARGVVVTRHDTTRHDAARYLALRYVTHTLLFFPPLSVAIFLSPSLHPRTRTRAPPPSSKRARGTCCAAVTVTLFHDVSTVGVSPRSSAIIRESTRAGYTLGLRW